MRYLTHVFCGLVLLATVGCVHYEYDIVRPTEFAAHVGDKQSVRFRYDALDYDFASFQDRLVIRVSNPNEYPIRLVSERSYVVDPNGQSHPIRGQTIAPGSYMKLVLPPVAPQTDPDGPRIGFGLGIIAADRPGRMLYAPVGAENVVYEEPRYGAVYDGNGMYWNWNGETDVRLSLYYNRETTRSPDTQPTTGPANVAEPASIVHEFDLHRRKM